MGVVSGAFADEKMAQRAATILQRQNVPAKQLSIVVKAPALSPAQREDNAFFMRDKRWQGQRHDGKKDTMVGGLAGVLLGLGTAEFVAATGPVALALMAGGGLMGALFSHGLPQSEAETYQTHFQNGYALLLVHDPEKPQEVAEVLKEQMGQDVAIH